MAAPRVSPPPQFLIRTRPCFYVDEKQKYWMVASLAFTPGLYPLQPTEFRLGTSTIVVLWQLDCTLGFPPIPLSLTDLPTVWRKCSLTFYWGSDGRAWKLEHHFQTGSIEQLVLKMDGYVGLQSEKLQIHYSPNAAQS